MIRAVLLNVLGLVMLPVWIVAWVIVVVSLLATSLVCWPFEHWEGEVE